MESLKQLAILFLILASTSMVPSNCFESRRNAASRLTTLKTIINGDEYMCVDIYKQPSLKHPALKDPQVKNRIHKYLDYVITKVEIQSKEDDMNVEGCPIGTVPILPRQRNQMKSFSNISLTRTKTTDFAGITIESTAAGTDTEVYTGAWATISVYNPHVVIKSSQFTAASMFLGMVDSAPINSIQVGWMVNPAFYGDQRTRLFTAWTADDFQHTGCYNTICKGFIQTSRKIPLGYAYPKISTPGKQQFDTQFVVKTMKGGGGWEFYTGYPAELIGHWPDYLFTSMKHSAKRLLFGGLAQSSLTDRETPPMGSGLYKDGDPRSTCYMRNVYVGNRNEVKIQPQSYFTQALHSRCYFSGWNQSTKDPNWNYRFLFGGTGGLNEIKCV